MASGGDVDVVSKLEKAISYACGILGYEKLRDFQKEGVAAVLKDQDVFVAKPTGSGKSLIFQLVPFATDFIHKFDSLRSPPALTFLPHFVPGYDFNQKPKCSTRYNFHTTEHIDF